MISGPYTTIGIMRLGAGRSTSIRCTRLRGDCALEVRPQASPSMTLRVVSLLGQPASKSVTACRCKKKFQGPKLALSVPPCHTDHASICWKAGLGACVTCSFGLLCGTTAMLQLPGSVPGASAPAGWWSCRLCRAPRRRAAAAPDAACPAPGKPVSIWMNRQVPCVPFNRAVHRQDGQLQLLPPACTAPGRP